MQEFEAYAAANCVKNNLKVVGYSPGVNFSSATIPFRMRLDYKGTGIFCPHGLCVRAVASNWASSTTPGVGFSYDLLDMNERPILTNIRYGSETLTSATDFIDGGYYLAPNEYFNFIARYSLTARMPTVALYGIEYIFSEDFERKFLAKYGNSRLSVAR